MSGVVPLAASQALVKLDEGVPQLLEVVVFQLLRDESQRHLDSPSFHPVTPSKSFLEPSNILYSTMKTSLYSLCLPIATPFTFSCTKRILTAPSSSGSCSGSASASVAQCLCPPAAWLVAQIFRHTAHRGLGRAREPLVVQQLCSRRPPSVSSSFRSKFRA